MSKSDGERADNLRDRILNAAWRTTSERGWSAVTMAQLGHDAGVSRQSVYNEFGSKQQVAEALVAREAAQFFEVVDAEIAAGTDPADSIQRAAERVLELSAVNPLLRATLSAAAGSPSPLLPLLTSQSQPLIDAAVERVRTGLHAHYAHLPPDPQLALAVDAIVRVVLSHVVQPGAGADMGFMARRLLAP